MATRDRDECGLSPRQDPASRPRILVHACCAPCSTVPLERLGDGAGLGLFFYNPNIHPRAEYERRLSELERLCDLAEVELFEGAYEPEVWEREVGPFAHQAEGSHTQRCQACYRLRMRATARAARARGFDRFCVTLTLSRHKDSEVLARIGEAVAAEQGVAYQHEDFKKRGGEALAARRSRQMGLYRQDYCGCRLSLAEAGRRRRGVVAP